MKLRFLLLFFLPFPLLLGCQQEEKIDLDQVQKRLSQSIDEAGQTIQRLTEQSKQVPDVAQSELEKIVALEYKVVKFDRDEDPFVLESELKALGEFRWDCFHVEPRNQDLIFFCKRRPKSYLRYALRAW